MKKPTSDTYYIKQFDWRMSPEVWKSLGSTFVYGFIVGAIVTAFLFAKSGHSAQHPTPTATVTVTSAP